MSQWATTITDGWARFVGPEATRLNTTIAIGSAVAGTAGAAWWAMRRGAGPGTAATMALLAADVVGGAYVNNTRACVRWYERDGQELPEHLRFAVLHVHPAVVAWADHRLGTGRRPVSWALLQYGYMLGSTVLLRIRPEDRRVLGVVLTAGGLVLESALGRSAIAPWFAWTYYPKLLLGHAGASLWPDQELGR